MSTMTPEERKEKSHEYERGYWAALNWLLGLINTKEDRLIPKKDLYHEVMERRPWHES